MLTLPTIDPTLYDLIIVTPLKKKPLKTIKLIITKE
jgi:hypothetical protein